LVAAKQDERRTNIWYQQHFAVVQWRAQLLYRISPLALHLISSVYNLNTPLNSVPSIRMCGAIPPLSFTSSWHGA
jgi:hypothetical protein